jgi:hypothetical protein
MKQLMKPLHSRKEQDRALPASLRVRYKAVGQDGEESEDNGTAGQTWRPGRLYDLPVSSS